MAIGATVSIAGGIIQRHKASKAEEAAADKAKEAAKQLAKDKEAFKNLDTSNPYLNMENTMEDLTVNQQEADFQKQQQQQSQANIMDSMRGAAGSSGVAGLAQTLANQGSLDAQKASASIGRQEAENQKLAAQEEGKIQGLEREGEMISRNAKADIASTMMGMTAQEMQAFQSQQAAAQAGMNAGSASIAQGAGMISQIDGDGKSMFGQG
tara:strand:- start:1083 stop:1712 length:630 start_codon:yes stop_codon:yes gene_type:complete